MSNSIADKLTRIAVNTQLLYNAGYEKGQQYVLEQVNSAIDQYGYPTAQTADKAFEVVGNALAEQYEIGYQSGYENSKAEDRTDISTLPNFQGVATENNGEYYYDYISRNSIWIPESLIPFDGEIGTTYLIKAAIKRGTCDRVGVAFAYEDGTLVLGTRDTNTDYRVYVAVSDPSKRLAHIALSYGSNGSCYVKDFTIEAVLKE